MSDIFERDIDDESENLTNLEDGYGQEEQEEFVFDTPLFCLKLAYSCESLYAKNDKNIDI